VLFLIEMFVFVENVYQVLIEDHRSTSVSSVKLRYANFVMVLKPGAAQIIDMNIRSSSRSHLRFPASRHIFPSMDQIVTQPFLFSLATPISLSNSVPQHCFRPAKL
jgi:hypothetical protein